MINKPRNKTLKLKPTLEIVEDENEEPIIQEEATNQLKLNDSEVEREKPTYINDNMDVTWRNNEYANLWNKLTPKFKQVLLSDHNWLEEYMYKCVNAKKQGKTCELFLPNFIPKIMENGSIDTGNPVINLEIKNLAKLQKEVLKGMIEETKDNDFKQFNSALISMIKDNIGFSKY